AQDQPGAARRMERGGEALALALPVVVERRVVTPRARGALREAPAARPLAVAIDAPVLGAEVEAAAAGQRRRRVARHQQQEAPGIERMGIDQMDRVAGPV